MGNIVKFAKPYKFEGTEYTEVDLSGMDDLTIQDMIDIQKNLANELAFSWLPWKPPHPLHRRWRLRPAANPSSSLS